MAILMKLRTKILGIESGGKHIVTLSKEDAEDIGVRSSERVNIKDGSEYFAAIVNIVTKDVPKGTIGVYEDLAKKMGIENGDSVDVQPTNPPESLHFIQSRLRGKRLLDGELDIIVKDVVRGNLAEGEIAAFVASLNSYALDMDEALGLSKAMADSGSKLKISKTPIVDKHSIGGVPGDKTSMLLVPIVAAAGLTIPKTSSRAITSAAGTADKAEVLMPVDLDIADMERVVEETGGCLVWGGALQLSPADDIFIKIEYPLQIDPLLMPSIMSKKKAVGAQYLVLDIPTGRGTKIKTIGEADALAKDFIELGKRMGIKTECTITYGEQPIGNAVGPALEAREALEILCNERSVPDMLDKVSHVAGTLFGMTGQRGGSKLAIEMIKSGKAEKKMREIIHKQGGDSEIRPADIKIGEFGMDHLSESNGEVLWIDNNSLVEVARAAGSPRDKGAGIYMHKKLGDSVKKGEKLFTIYSEKQTKLQRASKLADELGVYGTGVREEMLIKQIKEMPAPRKSFILER